jgi:hypothetical protein
MKPFKMLGLFVTLSSSLSCFAAEVKEYKPGTATKRGDRIVELRLNGLEAEKMFEGLQIPPAMSADFFMGMGMMADEEGGFLKMFGKQTDAMNCTRFQYPSLMKKENKDAFDKMWARDFEGAPGKDAFSCSVLIRYQSSDFSKLPSNDIKEENDEGPSLKDVFGSEPSK